MNSMDRIDTLRAVILSATTGREKLDLMKQFVELRKNEKIVVKANADATLRRKDAIAFALKSTKGFVTTDDGLVWALSTESLNKMIAATNKDGEKPYLHERIIAIQHLKELAQSVANPLISPDDGRDPQMESKYEYYTQFDVLGNVLTVRLLCKKFKPDVKDRYDKMHSIAMDKVGESPASQVELNGMFDDLEIVQLGGIGRNVPDLSESPSVINTETTIAQSQEPSTEDLDDLDPNSPNYRYRDTGYIAGSRKELAAAMIRNAAKAGTSVRAAEIDFEEIEQNPREAKTLITKSNLFGAVDWEAAKANGMTPAAGFLIDRVYASIAKEPEDNPQKRRDYALGIESIRDRMEKCKTHEDVLAVLAEIKDEWQGVMMNAAEAQEY